MFCSNFGSRLGLLKAGHWEADSAVAETGQKSTISTKTGQHVWTISTKSDFLRNLKKKWLHAPAQAQAQAHKHKHNVI